MEEIKKIEADRKLQEYFRDFDLLLDKAQLKEDQGLSCFLAGLKYDLEIRVRMFNPKTL